LRRDKSAELACVPCEYVMRCIAPLSQLAANDSASGRKAHESDSRATEAAVFSSQGFRKR
jgi:hypothetical protein